MKDMTVFSAAEAAGGRLVNCPLDLPLAGGVIDSREAGPGLMFCALPGERADGHEYMRSALEKGAACCLATHVPEGVTGPVILVDDVRSAMAKIAGACRDRLGIPVVGITGSSGKTTAKEMCAAVLSQKYNTLKTEKNFNNELGVPLTLFRIGPEHGAAVVELGINHFGEMSRLGAMAKPDIAVYTLIGRSHLEALGDLDGVLRAKGELVEQMPPDGLLIVNGDDEKLAAWRPARRKLTFGLGEGCDVRGVGFAPRGAEGSALTVLAGERRIELFLPAYGRHLAYAALAAAAVGIELGLSDGQIAAGAADYAPVGRRARIIETPSLTVIDDCYNANPDSVKMAIASAGALGGRLVCILGDMLELGEQSEQMHREVGEAARAAGALLLTAGERSAAMGGEHFASKAELISALPRLLKRGDRVLVKASHSMAFEEISDALRALSL
ncbi:MAG TPA: UDP-N-acetylmuramoyl-tripeptide--D-alanyl-D-alanine ligase [Candidatus Scatomorpha stercorigallinarum]|nr:UDP-N-acetylmuramoyl-tripeptide--D-alanyl-D-alanine ligase [Candidatus Scatomorpha stercorigallinarum]